MEIYSDAQVRCTKRSCNLNTDFSAMLHYACIFVNDKLIVLIYNYVNKMKRIKL
jgi:hypothetical protein